MLIKLLKSIWLLRPTTVRHMCQREREAVALCMLGFAEQMVVINDSFRCHLDKAREEASKLVCRLVSVDATAEKLEIRMSFPVKALQEDTGMAAHLIGREVALRISRAMAERRVDGIPKQP